MGRKSGKSTPWAKDPVTGKVVHFSHEQFRCMERGREVAVNDVKEDTEKAQQINQVIAKIVHTINVNGKEVKLRISSDNVLLISDRSRQLLTDEEYSILRQMKDILKERARITEESMKKLSKASEKRQQKRQAEANQTLQSM